MLNIQINSPVCLLFIPNGLPRLPFFCLKEKNTYLETDENSLEQFKTNKANKATFTSG